MKYTISIEIGLPREKVAQLIADPAQMPKWLRGLVLHEPVNGVHGRLGTTSRVVFQMGKQRMEATETITRVDPAELRAIPSSVVVHYDREIVGEGMWQAQRDRIIEAGPNKTLWESESEFRFDGPLMRLVALLQPGSFRKQSRQHMQDFKAFAEQGMDVRQGAN
ncbi:Polyketide cyclase / dehydrase and lipid transport [Promicromonospora umidemergens]|uniref:Polyketide cyclase/dehydrase/lipid transport protein n=1 Tax=Promicromonospora umidemergens TaxID=629679 RepID=A0ABP8X1P2_9MICO|nr:SRPBCC family protein [Promicromonospora umidemergens]MCP2285529.1 Polyketide cyclase / dehydrase and lipid transport [Promicromonospora umidemergens]